MQGNALYCLDREGKMRTLDIDTTEALFKLALERRDYAEVRPLSNPYLGPYLVPI